ncbi:MAG: SIMPL domain-containing protein [Pseudomonadales bacterium]
MQNTTRLITARGRIAAILLLAASALAAPGVRGEETGGIQVNGVGEIQAVPDMARLTLEVRREGGDVVALKRELDAVTGRVLEFSDELGVARRDVTAAAVNIYPRYQRQDDEQVPVGVIASRTIEIIVRDLADIGELINGALERGVNGVGGVQLDASNRIELEQQALDLAIDDAIREAGQIAKRFGVGLGPLTSASSGAHQVQPLMMDALSLRSAAKESFAPGEMTIRRDVQATFGIRP